MIDLAKKEQINRYLRKAVEEISISGGQYENLVGSYSAVGRFLSGQLEKQGFEVEIFPQGSVRLDTAVKPVAEEDDIDVDLVCEIKNLPLSWTQEMLKEVVGNCFKGSDRYRKMLKDVRGGHRCWTLLYREGTSQQYHMDILPAVVAKNYGLLLESFDYADYSKLAIYITDDRLDSYKTSRNREDWPKSNPFGYAKWFKSRCRQRIVESARESVAAVPKHEVSPSVLQDVIKLLKRHRDLMFDGDEDKPISIIITTIAAQAYQGEDNLFDALIGVINRMSKYVCSTVDNGRLVKKVFNPINPKENYAIKWINNPRMQVQFEKWLAATRNFADDLSKGTMEGLQVGLESMCGRNASLQVFEAIGEETKKMRDSGTLKVGATGLLGTIGTSVQAHNFYGE